jgi:hypothetical protein
MHIFKLLWQKELNIARNSYFRTKKQALISLAVLLLVGFIAIAGVTAFFVVGIRSLRKLKPGFIVHLNWNS